MAWVLVTVETPDGEADDAETVGGLFDGSLTCILAYIKSLSIRSRSSGMISQDGSIEDSSHETGLIQRLNKVGLTLQGPAPSFVLPLLSIDSRSPWRLYRNELNSS